MPADEQIEIDTSIHAMLRFSNLMCHALEPALDETEPKTTSGFFTFNLHEGTVADIHFLAEQLYLTAHRAHARMEAAKDPTDRATVWPGREAVQENAATDC